MEVSSMARMSTESVYETGSNLGGVNNMPSISGSAIVWIVIAAIALIGGLVLYFTFLSKRNEGKFKGFLGWAYEFFNFKKFTIEAILKITYLILAIFITLSSFTIIPSSPVGFLLMLILGNLVLRIVYEFSLVMLVICRNTIEINNKLTKKDE